jgi:hypothetical protein
LIEAPTDSCGKSPQAPLRTSLLCKYFPYRSLPFFLSFVKEGIFMQKILFFQRKTLDEDKGIVV